MDTSVQDLPFPLSCLSLPLPPPPPYNHTPDISLMRDMSPAPCTPPHCTFTAGCQSGSVQLHVCSLVLFTRTADCRGSCNAPIGQCLRHCWYFGAYSICSWPCRQPSSHLRVQDEDPIIFCPLIFAVWPGRSVQVWDSSAMRREAESVVRKGNLKIALRGGGGGGHGRPPKEGGGGLEKWGSVSGPLFCVRTDVGAKGTGTQDLARKTFSTNNPPPPPPHLSSQNDQRDVGIILSHRCWVAPPPPPARQVGHPRPEPPPSRHGGQGGRGGGWENGLPCHPPPPPCRAIFFPPRYCQRLEGI